MVKVLGLGDNVCDIYLNERTMYPGGQAVNFAVYAGMLGVKSDFMGVFGNDAIAGHVIQPLSQLCRRKWFCESDDRRWGPCV